MIRGYYETAEVAELMQISSVAVLKLAHRGTLHSNFLAGRRLFLPDDVARLMNDEAYMRRSRRGSQPKADTITPSLFEGNSTKSNSPKATQTAFREGELGCGGEEV